MLGVLAVIGVLSVAGIAGYSNAMNKHRANELINEANKRAVMIASQLMAGRDPESVKTEEFSEQTPYGTFSADIKSDGNDKFEMSVLGLDEETCNLLVSFVGGPLRRVDCTETNSTFTAKMYFNKDLSTEERPSDYNGKPTECGNKDGYQYCPFNNTCISQNEECPVPVPECPQDTREDPAVYTGGSFVVTEGSEAITCYCKKDEKWDNLSNKCVSSENKTCTSWETNECGTEYYCKFDSYETFQNAFCGYGQFDQPYYKSVTGTCQKIPSQTVITLDFDGEESKTFYRYSDMNWWSTASICNTNHNGLYSPEDIGITSYQSSASYSLTCACGNTERHPNESPIEDDCSTDNSTGCMNNKCNCWTYLQNKLGGGYYTYWTEEGFGGIDNSCQVRGLEIAYKQFTYTSRSNKSSRYFALCK